VKNSPPLMKRLFFWIILVIFLQGMAISEEPPPAHPLLFLELWNNVAFYDTNLEKQRFASLLGRFEGKVGFNVFDLPLQIYGVYYGVTSQADDYWDNYIYSGGGARIIPFKNFQGTSWANEWLSGLRIFYESLSSSYLKDAASAEALAKEDRQYGIEVYYEWNQDDPDRRLPWGELWMKYSSRDTNFGWEEFKDYVLYFQPKFGMHLGEGIGAYLRADLTSSGKEGADYSFLNIADYGVGVRFEPWRSTGETNDLFRKFKMFAEVLGVSYLKDKPTDPQKEVSSDVRFGIEFSYGR
jgi:hypothetical protein